jgi:hypothetical protein
VVEYYLRDAAPIAQINEDDLPQVAASVNPSHQNHFLPGIG